MNLEPLRHRYLRYVVAPLARALGARVSTAAASRLGRGVFELNTPDRQRAQARIRAAFADRGEAAFADRGGIGAEVRIAAGMYENLGRFWAEALFIHNRLGGERWRRHVRVPEEALLRRLAAAGHGCILATGYFGNVAAAACALGHIFRPVHVVVDWLEPGAAGALASWQKALYRQPWVRPIARSEVAARTPEVLSAGGAVLMVCEHERRRGRGVPARFLGARLNAYPTIGRLARWCDAAVGVVTCRREPRPVAFTLELHDLIEPGARVAENEGGVPRLSAGPATGGDDARWDEAVVRRCLLALERAILRTPEQYLWSVPVGAAADSVGRNGRAGGAGGYAEIGGRGVLVRDWGIN